MSQLTLENNEFLRQFEVVVNGSMARIEYAEQERKIFLIEGRTLNIDTTNKPRIDIISVFDLPK